ncbi:MAG: LapA family protein [Ignavibacteriae bacterium]|nr:LapA family protein [Ignavibacteriota bacterium]
MKHITFILALAVLAGVLFACGNSDRKIKEENKELTEELKDLEKEMKTLKKEFSGIDTSAGQNRRITESGESEMITSLKDESFLKKFDFYKTYRISGDAVYVAASKDSKPSNFVYTKFTVTGDASLTKYEFVPTNMDIVEAIKLSERYLSTWEGIKRKINKKIKIKDGEKEEIILEDFE